MLPTPREIHIHSPLAKSFRGTVLLPLPSPGKLSPPFYVKLPRGRDGYPCEGVRGPARPKLSGNNITPSRNSPPKYRSPLNIVLGGGSRIIGVDMVNTRIFVPQTLVSPASKPSNHSGSGIMFVALMMILAQILQTPTI